MALDVHRTPPPAPVRPPQSEGEMTIVEHLLELRQRLTVSAFALVITTILSAIFLTEKALYYLILPSGLEKLMVIRPTEAFVTYMKVALVLGAAIAMPVLIYEFLAFILPALLPHEKKYLWIAVPGTFFSFACGLIFGYIVILPFALHYLGHFQNEVFNVQWTADEYLDFVSGFLFWIGLSFETPLLLFFMAKLRIVNTQRLSRYRKYALLLAFVIAAIITPTPDPINQTLVAIPMYLLYEIGVLLSRLA